VALGTFDNFNQAIAGVCGLLAAAARTICDTLLVPSLDEASTHYGLIAEPGHLLALVGVPQKFCLRIHRCSSFEVSSHNTNFLARSCSPRALGVSMKARFILSSGGN
jgi:hypothetical protein